MVVVGRRVAEISGVGIESFHVYELIRVVMKDLSHLFCGLCSGFRTNNLDLGFETGDDELGLGCSLFRFLPHSIRRTLQL